MALTPQTAEALSKALGAVIEECGDDPQHAELVEHLTAARDALPEGEAREDALAEDDEPKDDEPTDNFDEARKRFMAKRKKGPVADEDEE